MANVRLYVNGQMVLPDIGKDMLSMVGWSDSENIKYCTRDKDGKFVPVDIILDSDRYIGYFGDESVILAISKNRNVTICVDVNGFDINEAKGYNYFVRVYHFSSVYTELSLPSIDLEVHLVDKDWMHLTWKYLETVFEADISTYL